MSLLTVVQAARALGISVQRVRVLCGSGQLPATRHGKAWVITDRAVANHERGVRGKDKSPRKVSCSKCDHALDESLKPAEAKP